MSTCQHSAKQVGTSTNYMCHNDANRTNKSYYQCAPGSHVGGNIIQASYGKHGKYCFGDFAKLVPRYYMRCYADSRDFASTPLEDKVKCCTGEYNSQDKCPSGLCNGSSACDAVMLEYCKDRPDDPLCGCALDNKYYGNLKSIGPLQCVDKRCTNPAAYKLTSQRDACNITNCTTGDLNLSAEDRANIDNFTLTQTCGQDIMKKLEGDPAEGNATGSTSGSTSGTNDTSTSTGTGTNDTSTNDTGTNWFDKYIGTTNEDGTGTVAGNTFDMTTIYIIGGVIFFILLLVILKLVLG